MKKLLALLFAGIMIISCVACGGGSSNDSTTAQTGETQTASGPQKGGVIHTTYSTFDDHLDINTPGASAGTAWWSRYVYENALCVGLDGQVYPLVCDYTVDNPDNIGQIRLKVLEGKKFHDGSLVTIEDVLASLLRATRRDIFADATDYAIEGDELVINFDVNIINGTSTLYWLGYYDYTYGIMPKSICDKFPMSESVVITEAQYVIGTGCYKLDPAGYIPQDKITMVRFEDYIGCTTGGENNGLASPRNAYVDKIILHKNSDGNNTLMHLLNGDYDVAYTQADTFQTMLEPMGFTMYAPSNATSNNMTLLFNLHDDSSSILKDDVNLRKAILAAADMPTMCYAEYSDWGLSDVHSPLVLDGYDTSMFDNADFNGAANVELAKQYLAQSNYNGQELVFRRPSTSGMAAIQELVQNLKDAGINAKMEAMEISAYQNDYHQGTTGWDGYILYGNGSNTHPCFIPVNNYKAWDDETGAQLRNKLFSAIGGTEASKQAWVDYANYNVEEVPCWTICKSKGDRFVCPGDLHLNYDGYSNFWNAYWDDPSAHME